MSPTNGGVSGYKREKKAAMADLEDHIKRLGEAANQVRKQLTSVNTDVFEHLLGTQKNLEKALTPIRDAHARVLEAAQSMSIPHIDLAAFALPQFEFPVSYLRAAEELGKSLQQVFAPALDQIQKSMRDLPPRTQEALLLLGSHGWYPDFEWSMPELWHLKDALSEGKVEEGEKALIEHFEARLDAIEKSLTEKFPHRAHLIQAAFGAHRRQEYALAIPVLLAQIDGICKDLTDKYFFIREKTKTKPEVAIYVEQFVADAFMTAFLSPLSKTLPINASQGERPQGTDLLNRHAVLHGESLNYGTQANSLKAISLINYMADVLEK